MGVWAASQARRHQRHLLLCVDARKCGWCVATGAYAIVVTRAVAASTRGAFVNIALQEPFGLTLIESAAHGLPTVATRHGGPVEIHATLKNGLLVEPTDSTLVAEALVTLLTDRSLWCVLQVKTLPNLEGADSACHLQGDVPQERLGAHPRVLMGCALCTLRDRARPDGKAAVVRAAPEPGTHHAERGSASGAAGDALAKALACGTSHALLPLAACMSSSPAGPRLVTSTGHNGHA